MKRRNGSGPEDELWLRLARAYVEQGRIDEATTEYRKVIEARPAGDGRSIVYCELADELARFGRPDEAYRYLQLALEECKDPELFQVLENQMAGCLNALGRGAEALGLMKLTAALAEALSDPLILAMAAMRRGALRASKLEFAEAAREYEQAASYGVDAMDLILASRAYHRASVCYLWMGAFEEWRKASDKALELATRCRGLLTLIEIHSIRALVHLMRGKWERAEEELNQGEELRSLVKQAPGEALYLITVDWYLRAWRGDPAAWDEIAREAAAAEFPHELNEPVRWIALAKLHFFRDHLENARIDVQSALERVPSTLSDGPLDAWLVGAFNVADCACDAESKDEALARYEHLKAYGHLLVPHALPALVLGRIASVCGMWEEAQTWLEEARERSVRAGMAPFEAMVYYELGRLYQRCGDLVRAERWFRLAVTKFADLGMAYYRDRADRLRRTVDKARDDGKLSAREAEVFRLWARGRTAGEIAKELIIEVSTVRSHIEHCKTKTNVRNQAEALAWCLNHGLLTSDDVGEAPIE
jgi:DNA-binding CsgD family transcriptional regulator